MTKFLPLDSPKALGMLNGFLGAESYVSGFMPTMEDVNVYKSFNGKEPEKRWANLSRWYAHLTKIGTDPNAWPVEWRIVEVECNEDLDLFGEETTEDKAENMKRRDEASKAPKAAVVSVSAVIFDVKPWGEDTDMKALEKAIREIQLPSLEWKAGEMVRVVGEVFALRILCHFTDDVFAVEEDLKAAMEGVEDFVQSVDIFAWNKR
jgi:elongation factor 1-beta